MMGWCRMGWMCAEAHVMCHALPICLLRGTAFTGHHTCMPPPSLQIARSLDPKYVKVSGRLQAGG